MEAERNLLRIDSAHADEHSSASAIAWPRRIPVEWLAYGAVALLSLWLRVTLLDSVPISDFEARQALHAWHTLEDDAPGGFDIARSPLTYLTQLVMFSLAGADAFNARIGTALAGLALGLAPLLFRDSLGLTRTFVWTVLLSLLTLPLAASRTADGTSFMLLFALLAVWMIRRYWYTQRVRDACLGIVFVTLMLLLSSPAGIPLLAVLGAAGWLAVWRTALSAPQRLDLPGDDILQLAVKQLRAFPFARALALPVVVVFCCATLFMLNPAGLSTVSQLIDEALAGMTLSASISGLRLGFIALAAQEPLLIVFACGGAWLLWKHGDVTYIDRFAAAWAGLGALALLVYPGARAADALWVVVPLTLLASYGITQLLVDRRVVALWAGADDDAGEAEDGALYTTQFWHAKWAISAAVLFCLFILSVQFMQVARLLTGLPAGASLGEVLALLGDASQLRLLQGLGLLLISGIICLVLFLLTASFWGQGTCLQGTGMGFLWLLLLSGIGGAWQASVTDADYPDSLWREVAVSDDAMLLRETLLELARQETARSKLSGLTIVTDASGVVSDRGLLAWLLRDLPEARFVNFTGAAANKPMVLMKEDDAMQSELVGNYVGQRFVLRRSWSLADGDIWDLPAWWSLAQVDRTQMREEAVILWLRQDVYDGSAVVG